MPLDHCHKGHRERLKQRFTDFGADALSDHELIEMLLYFSLPRVNTNDIAHNLIKDAGSLNEVFSSGTDLLKNTYGIGDSSALLISLIGEIHKRLCKNQHSPKKHFPNMSAVGKFLINHFSCDKDESISALYFDNRMNLISMRTVSKGDCHSAKSSHVEIVREALLKNAAGVIIAHNHPKGSPLPSLTDRNFTHVLEASLYAIEVILIEHMIVTGDTCMPIMSMHSATPRTLKRNNFAEGVIEKFFAD